jgi:hypothetical protein
MSSELDQNGAKRLLRSNRVLSKLEGGRIHRSPDDVLGSGVAAYATT